MTVENYSNASVDYQLYDYEDYWYVYHPSLAIITVDE